MCMDFSRHRRGFSLLELSIVLLIVSVMIGTGLSGWMAYLDRTRREATVTRQADVRTAIEAFVAREGRLPCPSSFAQPLGTAEYGRETDCTQPAVTGVDEIGNVLRRGQIPFRTLNLPYELTLDGWGNQLTYVVTNALAVRDTYGAGKGAIELHDGASPTSNPVTTPAGEVAYLVLSHGVNRKGAVPALAHVASVACVGTELDVENCNDDLRFNASLFNDGQAPATYFDDYIAWGLKKTASGSTQDNDYAGLSVYKADGTFIGEFISVSDTVTTARCTDGKNYRVHTITYLDPILHVPLTMPNFTCENNVKEYQENVYYTTTDCSGVPYFWDFYNNAFNGLYKHTRDALIPVNCSTTSRCIALCGAPTCANSYRVTSCNEGTTVVVRSYRAHVTSGALSDISVCRSLPANTRIGAGEAIFSEYDQSEGYCQGLSPYPEDTTIGFCGYRQYCQIRP